MTTELVVGIILTGLAYAGLIWAVVHGKHVVDRIERGDYPEHPNPRHRGKNGADAGE